MPAPSLTRFAELARRHPSYWAHQLAMAGLESHPGVPDWTKLCCCGYPRPDHTDADLACVAACQARRRQWRAEG